MRFRLSPEWRVLFVFADNTKSGGIRKYKKHRHSGESRNLISIPAKAGISAPKAQIVKGVQLPAALRRRRFLPSQEWNGV
ncbi:MAG: hypothetical protein ACR2QC_10590 [Gammaproteobacteria bacterium]